jgi:hypothetical protein
VAGSRHQLQQRRGRALARDPALGAHEPPREIVDACRADGAERCEINVALRLAAGSFEFKPWVAAVDGLIDCRTGIDGAAVAPRPLIPRVGAA